MNQNTTASFLRTSSHQSGFDKRIHEIDFVRGILILLVLFDHIMWLNKHYIGLDANPFLNWYWGSTIREVVRQICLWMFCFISGISSVFSHDARKRALIMVGFWFLIMAGSRGLDNLGIINQKMTIDFNIIGVLSFSMLFYSLIEKRSRRIQIALFVFSFLMWWSVVPFLIEVFPKGTFFAPLWCGDGETISTGLYGWKNYYADYLPLFPYMIAFFFGVMNSRKIYPDKKSLFRKKNWERPFCFLGRHTLIIYLSHQLLLIPIFTLFNYLIYHL